MHQLMVLSFKEIAMKPKQPTHITLNIINHRFLTTEANLKGLNIFRCSFTTSSVKLFVVTVQIFVSKFLFTIVFFQKGKTTLAKPFTF